MLINEISAPIIYKDNQKVDLNRFRNPCLSDEDVYKILNLPFNAEQKCYVNDFYPASEDLNQKDNFGYTNPYHEIHICIFVILFYILCSMFSCFIRPDFINVKVPHH
jgi:hypothetical protein